MGMSCGRTARSGEKRQRWEDKDESKEGMFREPEKPPRAEGSNNVPERVRLAVPKAAKKERRNTWGGNPTGHNLVKTNCE